jgi:hypothetical protein
MPVQNRPKRENRDERRALLFEALATAAVFCVVLVALVLIFAYKPG